MKINKRKFELILANQCISIRELQKRANISSRVAVKLNEPDYDFSPKIVGKVARALDVPVTDLLTDDWLSESSI